MTVKRLIVVTCTVKMAMLAEPRRKVKYSVDPRGTSWSKDDSKFGQKLMEKMGWSKGKGLGAKEDGKTEHVSVSLKMDSRGVGCSKSHADNWIAHQDDFNALLSNLNQDHADTSDSTREEKVLSLEETSRKSRGRVHYQKFTKGKDLSLKSASDLDCVLGKRKSRGMDTPQDQSEGSSSASEVEEEKPAEDMKTIVSTDNIQEYFAKKMAEKKARLLGHSFSSPCLTISETKNIEVNEEAEEEATERRKKKKSKKDKKRKIQDEDGEDDTETKRMKGDTENGKKSKRVSFKLGGDDDAKPKDAECSSLEMGGVDGENLNSDETEQLEVSCKKKKSKKRKREENNEIEEVVESVCDVQGLKNSTSEQMASEEKTANCAENTKKKSKKSKKAKKESLNKDDNDVHTSPKCDAVDSKNVETGAELSAKKKKKKKNGPRNLSELASNKDNMVRNKDKICEDEAEKYSNMIKEKGRVKPSMIVNRCLGKQCESRGKNRTNNSKDSNNPFKGTNINTVAGYIGLV